MALLSTQSAAASSARATDRACLVVRYSSWSADSHTPTSPFSFWIAATSAEKPSSPRRGGQCGPKCLDGPVSPSGCLVWHQLGQVVEVMPSVCAYRRAAGESGDDACGSRMTSVLWKALGRRISTITGQQGLTVNVQVRGMTERIAALWGSAAMEAAVPAGSSTLGIACGTSPPPWKPMTLSVRTAACRGAPFHPLACGAPFVCVAQGATGSSCLGEPRQPQGASHLGQQGDGAPDDVKIALASSAPVPMRARKAEAVLRGRAFAEDALEEAALAVCEEADPRTSWRATREFRFELLRSLTKRAIRGACEKAAPTIGDVS